MEHIRTFSPLLSLTIVAAAALFVCTTVFATDIYDDNPRVGLLPENLLALGSPGSYALVVSKADSRLEVYRQGKDGSIHRVETYRISTGRGKGDKEVEGDLKTPEGVYYFVRIREDGELPSKYGIRAFDTNYPNRIDRLQRKTGYGIWLHGTDEPERISIPRTSEGCVVLENEDVSRLSDYLVLYRTPVIIGEEIAFSDISYARKDQQRLLDFIDGWVKAWAHQDMERYSTAYHEEFRGGGSRRAAWFNRKGAVFTSTDWAEIDISDIKILRHEGYYVVSFYQRYKSNLMDDTGVKWVYIRDDEDGLGIISEEWHSVSKIRLGSQWHEKNVQLSQVVNQITDLNLSSGGTLAMQNPQITHSSRQEFLAAQKAAQEQKRQQTAMASDTTSAGSDTDLVRIEEAQLAEQSQDEITIQFKLTNTKQTGIRRRGWVYLVAHWNGSEDHTAFPNQLISSGRPASPAAGDSYGIKWFKTVTATIPRPSADARLDEVRAYIYDKAGTLIGSYPIVP